jgi:hypothetical protein
VELTLLGRGALTLTVNPGGQAVAVVLGLGLG